MARVVLARGGVWLRKPPKPFTQAQQAMVLQYIRKATHNPLLELQAYVASGALSIFNPLDKVDCTRYKQGSLAQAMGYRQRVTSNGGVQRFTNERIRARVCHNMKG